MAIVIAGIRKEILSFEYDGRDEYDRLKALVYGKIVYKGLNMLPRLHKRTTYSFHIIQLSSCSSVYCQRSRCSGYN